MEETCLSALALSRNLAATNSAARSPAANYLARTNAPRSATIHLQTVETTGALQKVAAVSVAVAVVVVEAFRAPATILAVEKARKAVVLTADAAVQAAVSQHPLKAAASL